MKAALPLTLAACAALLAGCDKMGELERPGPLFGQPSSAPLRDPDRGINTVDPRDNARTPPPAGRTTTPADAADTDAAEPQANPAQ